MKTSFYGRLVNPKYVDDVFHFSYSIYLAPETKIKTKAKINRTALISFIVILIVVIATTLLIIAFFYCRRGQRNGRRMKNYSVDADYLINGLYLWSKFDLLRFNHDQCSLNTSLRMTIGQFQIQNLTIDFFQSFTSLVNDDIWSVYSVIWPFDVFNFIWIRTKWFCVYVKREMGHRSALFDSRSNLEQSIRPALQRWYFVLDFVRSR